MTTDILCLSALELVQKYKQRELSPVEVTEAMLAQIERVDSHTNAYCLVDADTTLDLARQSERRYMNNEVTGLVDGVPVTPCSGWSRGLWSSSP